ncbi:hypothetical protein TNIN_5201 [Trichonephila inaurata madagascariensis]|uniref:Uncharacterized protein n=1 Tax=Trichonephila inaurata madagascariensis TaxID=2747483 RepID=A0A8X6XND9_9ARAC|nr:hypothetical protein TNIN_5201 [Trichonephila inaurata madagascariensis]
MREENRSRTRFQVKENDVDSPSTCFTGEIVVPKRRLCYPSFPRAFSRIVALLCDSVKTSDVFVFYTRMVYVF